MKKIILTVFCTIQFFFVLSQQPITIRFNRPSKLVGAASKIYLKVQNEEISLSNGSSSTITVVPDYTRPLEIQEKQTGLYATKYLTKYSLRPRPNETYEFQVGFGMVGINVELKSGQQAAPGETFETNTTDQDSAYWNAHLRASAKTGGIAYTAEKDDPSEVLRQKWMQQGGKIKSSSQELTGMYFRMDIDDYGILNGYGGGISMHENFYKLKVPEFKPGTSTWSSFTMGYGFDWLLSSFNYTIEQTGFSMSIKSFSSNIMLIGNFGWTLGIGQYKSKDTWRGVALLLKYRPTLNGTTTVSTIETKSSSPFIPNSKTSDSNTDFNFNLVGFGFDFQFSNYVSTMERLAPKPTMKLSFFFLPPTDKSPLFVSVSLGYLIYKSRE